MTGYAMRVGAAALLFAAGALLQAGFAQERYPAKPVRVIAAIAAGSLTDLVLRKAVTELSAGLGQPVLIDNRPGANTVVGADACAKSAPDGYTYCVVNRDTVSVIPYISQKLPYNAERDLAPVTALYHIVQGLVTSALLPVGSVKELRALASTRSEDLNFGTFGAGSNPDIARQWLNEQWGAKFAGIPYKGANLIVNALLSGEIHLTRISLGSVTAQVKVGKVKILAIGSARRSRQFPEVPTYTEAGMNDSPEGLWWGLFAPAGTPDSAIRILHAQFARVFREAQFVEFLESQSLEPGVSSAEEFAEFLKRDKERGRQTVIKYNVPLE